MDTYRKYSGHLTGNRYGHSDRFMADRFMNVGLPLPHEGVGKALRSIFRPSRQETPQDMLDLLAKLDRAEP